MIECADAIIFSWSYNNLLDAIGAIDYLIRIIEDCEGVRAVFEIMLFCCEYVDEFADVQAEIEQPAKALLVKLESLNVKAQEVDSFYPRIYPLVAARDI